MRAGRFTGLAEARAALDDLVRRDPPAPAGGWTLPQALVHCAQSIELSLSGYPRPKPWLFRALVGPLALRSFARRGALRHDRAAQIPGLPVPEDSTELAPAAARLRAALDAFEAHPGPHAPHFAYGRLTRSQYALAHAMHLADHFAAFA